MDSTTPDAEVIDKNQGPSWTDPEKKPKDDKENEPYPKPFSALGKYIVLADGTEVTENSANYGDTVNFKTSFNATNYIGTEQILTYFLWDTIDNGFTIKKDSLEIYVHGTKLTSGYTVTWSDANGDNVDDTFKVSIPWDDAEGKPIYDANSIVMAKYSATVNNEAVLAGDGNLNTTFFDYRLGDDKTPEAGKDVVPATPYHKSEEKQTTTYVYAFGLTKIDGTTKNVLHGAEFTLKRGTTDIKAKATATAGVYEYDATDKNTVFKTDDKGVLVIKGLEEGTYSLTETKAPKGYNRTLTATEFTIAKADKAKYTASHSVYYNASGAEQTTAEGAAKTVTTNYGVNVLGMVFQNERGVELPVTGGVGTTLFYILGGVLVFGAMLLLITKKRMKAEK